MNRILILVIILAVAIGGSFALLGGNKPELAETDINKEHGDDRADERADFSYLSPIFRFSASLHNNLKAEYLPATESLNIYAPDAPGNNNLEKSQIFIRHFTADRFLTLSTVDILSRQETKVGSHEAVKYEIEKKSGVPNFSGQPTWRNAKHKLIDVRYAQNSPSIFYVFAYNPDFGESEFEKFISSLIFHNDKQSLSAPMDNAGQRVTKKPFGLFVTPQNSPVSPEKFSGFHSGTDYEILAAEENSDVSFYAVCGGEITQKRTTQGYGGLLVQSCTIESEQISVIYGHVKLSSITKNVGDYFAPGEKIGVLGDGYSSETDNERKHLHLGIFKGSNNIRGYVESREELNNWIDFEKLRNK